MGGLVSITQPASIENKKKNARTRCCIMLGSLFSGGAEPTAGRRADYAAPFKTRGDAAKDDGSRWVEETKILMTDEGGGGSRMVQGFIVDSGASVHATGNRALLSWYESLHTDRFILGASGHRLRVSGSGSVCTDRIILNDVLYVPGLEKSVVSVAKLAELNYGVDFGKTGCFIRDDRHTRNLVGKGRRVAGLYQLDYLKIPLDRKTVAQE
ncbi:uncharacterized protein [Triticum aestivum]|uniref:uncharacterized protein n=1 Tax=Triticum aestivum TaxID=4565 RepID=UPI000DF56D54|nr:uncharacterized protein LOC123066466 [Triticum aestivum]